jgi:hypothetical protein
MPSGVSSTDGHSSRRASRTRTTSICAEAMAQAR